MWQVWLYGYIRTGFLVLMVALADYLKFVLEIERGGFFWYVGGEDEPLSRYSDCGYRLGGVYMQSETKMQPCGQVTGKGGEIILYKAKDGRTSLEVRLEQDTVWLGAH